MILTGTVPIVMDEKIKVFLRGLFLFSILEIYHNTKECGHYRNYNNNYRRSILTWNCHFSPSLSMSTAKRNKITQAAQLLGNNVKLVPFCDITEPKTKIASTNLVYKNLKKRNLKVAATRDHGSRRLQPAPNLYVSNSAFDIFSFCFLVNFIFKRNCSVKFCFVNR